jgi:hypothetical protein
MIRNRFSSVFISTVESGTMYELYVQSLLNKKYNFNLERVGGSRDRGIDLIGSYFEIPIVVQCKYYSGYLSPNFIRELQGVVTSQNADRVNSNWLGLLVCNNGVKEGSLEFLRASNTPLGLLILEIGEEYFRGCIFNNSAKKLIKFLNQKSIYYLDQFGNQVKGVELISREN